MWIYDRKQGIFKDEQGLILIKGCYSGHGVGLNNPLMEDVHDVGPLPANLYTMTNLVNSDHTGNATIILISRTHPFNRDGFRIHGDNKHQDFSASNGCIIMDLENRLRVWKSNDHILKVI